MPEFYKNFFGLLDNPFSPSVVPHAGAAPAMLATFPLVLYQHPELRALYCDEAGPFRQYEEDFRTELELADYSPIGPRAGTQTFIILITGPEGTGKTTLMSAMVELLERCRPSPEIAWKRYDGFEFLKNKIDPTPDQQDDSLNKVAERMREETAPDDYCCLIVDNYLARVDIHALNIFDEMIGGNRRIVLFLTPARGQATDDLVQISTHQIHEFKTREINPDQALAFVRHRVGVYRDSDCFNCTAERPLFPFADQGIRDAVTAGVLEGAQAAGSITIRQLGKTLGTFLVQKAKNHLKSDKSFNIAQVPCSSLDEHLIDPLKAYAGLMQAFG